MTLIRTITLGIDTDRDDVIPRVLEVLARASAGLLLDGIESHIHCHQFDDEEAD